MQHVGGDQPLGQERRGERCPGKRVGLGNKGKDEGREHDRRSRGAQEQGIENMRATKEEQVAQKGHGRHQVARTHGPATVPVGVPCVDQQQRQRRQNRRRVEASARRGNGRKREDQYGREDQQSLAWIEQQSSPDGERRQPHAPQAGSTELLEVGDAFERRREREDASECGVVVDGQSDKQRKSPRDHA